MLSSLYFLRAYFGGLLVRRSVVAVVVPPAVVPPLDLAELLRQLLVRFDRIEKLITKV